jgi:outer membrane receptor protein involved in Fe transport
MSAIQRSRDNRQRPIRRVRQRRPDGADIDPFDLDHIEVLRGPQGTLYGASSIGLIKYVMAKPDTTGFSARTELDGSSTQHGGDGYGARGMVNIPVSDGFAVRLSAFKRQDPGYLFDPLQNRKNVNEGPVDGGRLVLLWRINDAVSIQSSALVQDSEAGGTSDVDVNFNYQPLYGPYEHERLPGGRYSKNIQDFIATDSGPLAGGITSVQTGTSSGNAVTYQVSPRYKITDNVQAYARVASGYRPGGPNGIIPGIVIPLSYKADTTVNYELGLKGEFLDHALILETAVYYIDWHNIQVQLTDQQNGSSYTTNGCRDSADRQLSGTRAGLVDHEAWNRSIVVRETKRSLAHQLLTGKRGDGVGHHLERLAALLCSHDNHLEHRRRRRIGGRILSSRCPMRRRDGGQAAERRRSPIHGLEFQPDHATPGFCAGPSALWRPRLRDIFCLRY